MHPGFPSLLVRQTVNALEAGKYDPSAPGDKERQNPSELCRG